MSDCGTSLNIDHRAEVEIVVVDDTVELRCHGTEIEFDAASLARLIDSGEQAVSRLGTGADALFRRDRAVSTWVAFDSQTPLRSAVRGGTLEMLWGQHTLSVTGAALPDVLRRARLARTELDRRRTTPPYQDIPDPAIPGPGGATCREARRIRTAW